MKLKNVFSMASFISLASAALMGYGFTSNQPYVFLAPFLVLIPGSFLVKESMSNLIYMGAYISHKIESGEKGIRFSTYYHENRKMREANADQRRFFSHLPKSFKLYT
jgi:hypothetical protein